MNISATRGPIAIKIYLKHHCGGGQAVIAFGPDWIRTLASIATDSSHRVIMGKILWPLKRLYFLIESSSFLRVTRTTIKSLAEFEFWPDPTMDLSIWKNPHRICCSLSSAFIFE